jgi:uncharacterized protein YcfJ
MRNTPLSLALAATFAGLALASCARDADNGTAEGGYVTSTQPMTTTAEPAPAAPAAPATAPAVDTAPVVEYADVTRVRPVSVSDTTYGTVIASEPVTQDTSQAQQVCHDEVVQERLPERDGLKGGTIAGAIIGGVLGNQAGSGDGKKLATVAGAVAGGYAGREIDRRHEGGNIVSRTEQKCETQTVPSSQVIGYDVRYRTSSGATATKRMASSQPVGSRIALGSHSHVVGYDVTYVYHGASETIRMDRRPGDRLSIVDGEVVTTVASR